VRQWFSIEGRRKRGNARARLEKIYKSLETFLSEPRFSSNMFSFFLHGESDIVVLLVPEPVHECIFSSSAH